MSSNSSLSKGTCKEYAYDPVYYCKEVDKESTCDSKTYKECCDGKEICPDPWFKSSQIFLIGAPIALTFLIIVGILIFMYCKNKKKKGPRGTGTGTGTYTGTRTGGTTMGSGTGTGTRY